MRRSRPLSTLFTRWAGCDSLSHHVLSSVAASGAQTAVHAGVIRARTTGGGQDTASSLRNVWTDH